VLSGDAILSLLSDSQNRIWVGSYNGGLDLLDPHTLSSTRIKPPSSSPDFSELHVNALYEDKRGNIWIGTMLGGLFQYDQRTGTFTIYSLTPRHSFKAIHRFFPN